MGAATRTRLTSGFWQLLEPSLHSYSDMIERLLGYLDESELSELVTEMRDDDGCDEEDECDE